MIHCPICGNAAKAQTTERRKDGKNWMRVYVYHHEIKQCREFEYEDEGDEWA